MWRKVKVESHVMWRKWKVKVQWLCRRERKRDIDNCFLCCSENDNWPTKKWEWRDCQNKTWMRKGNWANKTGMRIVRLAVGEIKLDEMRTRRGPRERNNCSKGDKKELHKLVFTNSSTIAPQNGKILLIQNWKWQTIAHQKLKMAKYGSSKIENEEILLIQNCKHLNYCSAPKLQIANYLQSFLGSRNKPFPNIWPDWNWKWSKWKWKPYKNKIKIESWPCESESENIARTRCTTGSKIGCVIVWQKVTETKGFDREMHWGWNYFNKKIIGALKFFSQLCSKLWSHQVCGNSLDTIGPDLAKKNFCSN